MHCLACEREQFVIHAVQFMLRILRMTYNITGVLAVQYCTHFCVYREGRRTLQHECHLVEIR